MSLLLTLLFTIVSYNCENLFDCRHDSLKNDYEFLPPASAPPRKRTLTLTLPLPRTKTKTKTLRQAQGEAKTLTLTLVLLVTGILGGIGGN